MEGWTKDKVRDWLISDVKVSPTDAQRFFEEDVSGEYLVEFTKREILDMGIKHGPAVKITNHLNQWKDHPQTQPQCPAYVLSWTKEQVKLWLLRHVKLYDKYAQKLLEEEVSGDCLVYFEKQDFKDLDIKQGPIVKILAELGRLKDKAEPELLPEASTEEKQLSVQPEPSVSQPVPQNKSSERTTSPTTPFVQNTQRTPPQQPSAPNTKTTAEVSGTGSFEDNIEIIIYNVLNNLVEEEIKAFCFHLGEYTSSKHKQIPRSKLEKADQTVIAALLCENYMEDAPHVTVEILRAINKCESASELEKAVGALEAKKMPSKGVLKAEADQGDKLKNLLTCGGNALDNYDKFVIVLNKSRPEQVQHLHFLTKLKLFCVLDFDPKSVLPGGACHSYREERVANLHSPAQYEGTNESIIEKLNLYKQTSWVFCNGRKDLEDESHQELDYKTWLKTSCRDVEHLVSFICKPEVLCHREFLIIFLLLSPVETEKDPMFDTYRCFYKHTSEKNIVTLSESKSTYLKWRELVQEKCDTDIDPVSINELSLREINGTIMALGPISRSTVKLLPSAGSSFIELKQKEEDLMTALEVLCVNQCENIHDENSEQFKQFKLKQEEEFYRGGKVKWWNFYFCEKDKERPFIKRDKYENVKKMIRQQLQNSQNTCIVLTLFHHPGCGATTLAMHVMWDLRKELRCAVLKENKVLKEEVAHQIIKLMKLDHERPCTVLLLVDDSKDSTHELLNFIQKAVSNMNIDHTQPCKVIILNCVRSHSPMDQYREHNNVSFSQYLTASLTPEEQQDFEKKLKELEKSHNKPENFYSFMLMKRNFDPQYTRDLASNTLESFDMSTKKGKLFAFLALLNTYVADSGISVSLCEDFLGIKVIRWGEDSVLKQMAPYSNLLIIEKVEDWGGYKGVRILHNHIAAACLEEFGERHELTVSDITMEILHCDLLYSAGVVKNRLMMFIEQMLIERQRKKGETAEREPFSPLVEKIHNEKGREIIQDIFVQASSRFEASASIPQALARYLYIKEQDFPEALKWAQKAAEIAKNPFTLDTIAQVHKSHLKYNMDREKQAKSHSPDDLNQNLKTAVNAIQAFERAQELAPNDDDKEAEDDQDYPRKSYTIYGYVGVVEITFLVFEVLGRLPFFNENQDPMNKTYLRSYLEGNIPITSVHKENNEINDKYVAVVREHERDLLNLKNKVKDTFEIVNSFFTYLKPIKSEFDSKNRRTISEHLKKYVKLFCTKPEQVKTERQSNPQLALKMAIEQRRLFLEEKNADTFSGILQHLDSSAEEMEDITQAYAYLYKHKQVSSKKQATKVTTNYILSNIVLNLSKPKSKHMLGYTVLSEMLRQTLQDVDLCSQFPDPYYTALLLFWPKPSDGTTDIQKYVTAIQRASRQHLSYFKGRSTVAHLFLAKGSSLTRLVSKLQLDKNFKGMSRNELAQLWRSGDIFREKIIKDRLLRVKGTIEGGEIFAKYGSQKVPVRPALISGTRSGSSIEKVSFFLGFAINGPLAYDIQSEY